MKKPRILVMGSLVMDLISRSAALPQAGETVLGEAFSTASGGKGANQAMQAALLGAEVAMMGKVGSDSFGRQMCASLAAAGVNVDAVEMVEGPSGIGKPAHIAGYIASLFSSTGTPTYFLHGTEAVHGSAGQLERGDIVICISNSGETAEMKATVQAIQNNGCTVIGVSGNPASWLAKASALHLTAHVDNEGGPLNRAPRASILAETLLLQALSVLLQANSSITPQNYVRRHPGGALGKLRDNEK